MSAGRTRDSGPRPGRRWTCSTPTGAVWPKPRWPSVSRRRTWYPFCRSNPRSGNGSTSCENGTATARSIEDGFHVLSPPTGFSWIDRPHLAASARPGEPEELAWLRQAGIQLLLTLSEDRVRRDSVDAAGLLVMHVPIIDMTAPTQEQLEQCVSALARARSQGMGV